MRRRRLAPPASVSCMGWIYSGGAVDELLCDPPAVRSAILVGFRMKFN